MARWLRTLWRRGIRTRWHSVRGPVLLAMGITTLVLGTIGWRHVHTTPRYGLLDAVYRSLTLFGFGGTAPAPTPVTLEIARIMGPFLTGYAAIGAIIALSRDQARVLGIRLFVRRHVLIAGLGAPGRRLAASLVDDAPVVVIEADRDSEHLPSARLRGVRALLGTATDPAVLRQAGVQRAETLVIACGSDQINVEVAEAAARSLGPRGRPLTIFVHVENLDLWSSLTTQGGAFRTQRPDVRVEYFNILTTGAQLLLERRAPFERSGPLEREHILLVGMAGIGEQLALGLVRQWRTHEPHPDRRLAITLTGPDAEAQLTSLRERYPLLERHAALDTRPMELGSAAFATGAAMCGTDGRCDITRAYVNLADEADALLAALALHARDDADAVPVTVCVQDATTGIGVVLGSERGRFAGIDAFGYLAEASDGDLLLRGTNELVARAQHAQWLRHQLALRAGGASAAAAPENPYLRPWEQLTDAGREANRRFADDLHAKLALIGAEMISMPLPDPGADAFRFSEREIEVLSRHEHARWSDQMAADGWRYGPERDNERRIHPQMKPWEELSEAVREQDREAVRAIPETLAAAGFTLRRDPDLSRGPAVPDPR